MSNYEGIISASCTLYAAPSRSEEQKRAAILNYCFLQQSPGQMAEFVHWRAIKRHGLHKNSGKKKEVLFLLSVTNHVKTRKKWMNIRAKLNLLADTTVCL
ncbi:hypothetical protein CHARACLAT_022713 [Characodon lateralis]|uniref:Uncharacterized protein n=1 Tax=Characodon lateralis TaxID=208331 RepID=A0ABU7CUH2_9TELE|nr:hypothetical protein [Characodon lateralis]